MNKQVFYKTFITTLAMLFILTEILAYTSNINELIVQPIVTPIEQSSDQTTMTESEAYKLLYDNVKESNDKLVTTVQWVIGIALAFLLAILGSQIFFNWKINTKDIEYIKKDIDEKILALKGELISSLDKKSKEIQTLIDKKITDTEIELKEDIKDKFESRMKFFNLKSETIEQRMKDEVKLLKRDIEKNEGDIWTLKGVESNALSSYLRSALLEIELDREVKYILNDIIAILEKLEEIHQFDYSKLDELTSKLTALHKNQQEKIISLYKNKPVYRFVERPNTFEHGSLVSLGGHSGKEYVKNKPTK
jgi:regulatory protein YycI of two-component signal transduction system YycFG